MSMYNADDNDLPCTGNGSWQSDLTPHQLSHTNFWAYLTQGLTLLGNLCGLSAIIKEVSAAVTQVKQLHALLSLRGFQQP